MKKNELVSLRLLFFISVFLVSCGKDNPITPDPDPDPPLVRNLVKANPNVGHQEMIGFGAALTWWSDRVINSPKRDELYALMFEDLGMDILRLKNWYYPLNYPENKSPTQMVSNGDRNMFLATNEFFDKAKAFNPNIKVLLSSWGPPASLKSNNHLREGTLKKVDGEYVYDEFAQYWEDILDNLPFNPDFIGIQNEPGYTNPGWTTCGWAPIQNANLAGFDQAMDRVWEKIKDRSFVPEMVAPEAENINAWNSFMQVLSQKNYLNYYGWHPYNFNENTPIDQTNQALSDIKNRFGQKPNIMTEYSNMSWLKTARFIHRALTLANTSAYIYWELVWGDPNRTEFPMINIDGSGNYTVTGFYHLIKHFSKFIDQGYTRIDASSSVSYIEVSAYKNPNNTEITYVIINPDLRELEYEFEVEEKTVKSIKAFQSVQGDYFKELGGLNPTSKIKLLRNSITTVVVGL